MRGKDIFMYIYEAKLKETNQTSNEKMYDNKKAEHQQQQQQIHLYLIWFLFWTNAYENNESIKYQTKLWSRGGCK